MDWFSAYGQDTQPTVGQIAKHICTPLWESLCGYLELAFQVQPRIEHSTCSGAPGWNVKYRKSGKALCTLYPHAGYYTCLVSIGAKEAAEAELLLPACTEQVQQLYNQTRLFNGGRWLMIDVRDAAVLEDAKKLIHLRVKSMQKA